MAAIVYQTDKRSGITYAYESVSYWDKEKKQSRAKRTLVGRLDPVTGNIVPTDQRRKKALERGAAVPGSARHFCGAVRLLDGIGEITGITGDLKRCFPDRYEKILSVAYYLILEDANPLTRFAKWAAIHEHPYGRDISSQRSSELFASITEEERTRFFALQGKRRAENEYWAYDITAISSYSECLRQIRYGVNKDHDPLPQLNLALVFGEESGLPFYYRKLPGNISDVKTVRNLLADLDSYGLSKVKLVMDRGFYSEENINRLYREHLKFLIGAKLSLKFVRAALDEEREKLRSWERYDRQYDLYACTRPVEWDYAQTRPYKGDTLKEKRRMYLHLYYNSTKGAEDERRSNLLLAGLQEELMHNKRVPEHENLYAKYFELKETPVRGTQVTAKQEAIDAARKNFGYFALISNESMDAIKALELYRNKDLCEKAFGNLKERLNMRRMLVSSEQSLDGKLFVEFVSLIFLSYIKKQMQEHELFKDYTIQGLLDELDIIECYKEPGKKTRLSEITKRQAALYQFMDVSVHDTTSLC